MPPITQKSDDVKPKNCIAITYLHNCIRVYQRDILLRNVNGRSREIEKDKCVIFAISIGNLDWLSTLRVS